MVSNQHIRRKKRKEKFLDVKLLTTNRTTVQEDILHGKVNPPVTSEAGARWPRRGGVFPRRHVFAE
jgi:hypothetical protein